MARVSRDTTDLGKTGHGCTAFIGVKATQFNVRANNKPILRKGDPALPHTIPTPLCTAHLGAIVNEGSRTVRVHNKPVARVGDPFDMGVMFEGSSTVRAG